MYEGTEESRELAGKILSDSLEHIKEPIGDAESSFRYIPMAYLKVINKGLHIYTLSVRALRNSLSAMLELAKVDRTRA